MRFTVPYPLVMGHLRMKEDMVLWTLNLQNQVWSNLRKSFQIIHISLHDSRSKCHESSLIVNHWTNALELCSSPQKRCKGNRQNYVTMGVCVTSQYHHAAPPIPTVSIALSKLCSSGPRQPGCNTKIDSLIANSIICQVSGTKSKNNWIVIDKPNSQKVI